MFRLDDGSNNKGVSPLSLQEQEHSTTIRPGNSFNFDVHDCLEKCSGNCCYDRSYLQIGFEDIFRILASPAAAGMGLFTTIDLYSRPFAVLELKPDHNVQILLPYLRFIPLGTESDVSPELAPNNMCHFLRPIKEVTEFHDIAIPFRTGRSAMGCFLMDDKPQICQMSPLGEMRGLESGGLEYRYTKPTNNCPACESSVKVDMDEYFDSVISQFAPGRELFHLMLKDHLTRLKQGKNQKYFRSILTMFYNIDLLISCQDGIDERPGYEELMRILIPAASGEFGPYYDFISGLGINCPIKG